VLAPLIFFERYRSGYCRARREIRAALMVMNQ